MADNKDVKVYARLTSDVKETLEQMAKEQETTVSSLVRLAIKEYIENH